MTRFSLGLLCLQDVLFEQAAYVCDSKHHNLIAFELELALLRRVLQAAGANDADSVEVTIMPCCRCHSLCMHLPCTIVQPARAWRGF